MCTIVTGYFQMKSKHSTEKYAEWIKYMLEKETPMVIFCDKQSYPMIHAQRPYQTKIIITSLTQFYSYKYIDTYRANYEMDHETYHSPELYLVWAEKAHFVKQAITMNPFQTDYFLWVDIGCFREPSPIQWPNPIRIQSLDSSKVLVLNVTPFTEEELHCTKETLPSFLTTNRIGATIFGGGKEILLKYHDLYYEMVDYFISIDRFIGKDQSILNSVYLLNQELFQVVKPGKCKDEWFYLQNYLSVSMGAYLQCYKNPYATYKCLESFRTYYPDATVVLLSDNGYDYTEMAKHFGCIYIHEKEQILLTLSLEQDYITESCKLIERIEKVFPLIQEDYIMWLEDDVSVNGVIQDTFRYDLNGYCPNTFNAFWNIDKKKYPLTGVYHWSGHGGSVFHKNNFLTYLKNKEMIRDILVHWKQYNLTSNVGQDFFWSLIITLHGGTIGPYQGHEDCTYKNDSITVQHQYKVWYHVPMPEELSYLFT